MLCAVSAGCPRGSAGGGQAATAGFSIRYPDAEALSKNVKLGARFSAPPQALCTYDNGREARWTMSSAKIIKGDLPPGLTLEDGVIGGVPTKAGTFSATIELFNVVCAGKPYPGRTVDVLITVK
jgi:hypothetical protein